MSRMLDRPGTFKVVPVNWNMQGNDNTQSVAMVIEFRILGQIEDGEWESWEECEEHTITGWFYVVGKTGTINQRKVDDLAKSIGWDGSPGAVLNDAPNVVCQIVVVNGSYQGKARLEVEWINPEGYAQGSKKATPEVVNNINARFGSQLRAAAALNRDNSPAPGGADVPPPVSQSSPPAPADPNTAPVEEDDLPFDGAAPDSAAGPGAATPPLIGTPGDVPVSDGEGGNMNASSPEVAPSPVDLDTMDWNSLRAHSDVVWDNMTPTQRGDARATIECGDHDGLVEVLREVKS